METLCPDCGVPTIAAADGGARCAACGREWQAAAMGPVLPSGAWEFELQRGAGLDVEGPYDAVLLREWVYTGQLRGDERVRVPGSSVWEQVADRPALARILELTGREIPGGRARVKGWRPQPGAARQEPEPEPEVQAPAPSRSRLPLILVAVVVVLLLIAALAVVLGG